MADKKFIGTFPTETEVLKKIDELKTLGYKDDDIYVVTNDEDSLSIVRGQTNVSLQEAEGNWWDRFVAFLSGDEPVKAAFTHMGFTDEEATRYYTDVKNGNILLYVDRDYGDLIHSRRTEFQGSYRDPNLGGNLTVDNLDNTAMNTGTHVDAEQEERLRLHEEKLNVDKERVQTGEVNVGKHVVQDEQTVEVPVKREEVHIERRAATDETAATGEVFNDENDNIHIPVMEEHVEVTKRPVVSEEIVVKKHEVNEMETVNETVRREEADIDRTDDDVYDRDKKLNTRSAMDRTIYDIPTDQDRI